MKTFEGRILGALNKEGEISVSALESLYTNRRADAVRVSWMHRKGLVEWVRSVHGRAIAIRITDTGRTAFAELKE